MAKRVTGLGRGLEALLPANDLLNDRLQQMKQANAIETTGVSPVLDAEQKVVGTQIQELGLNTIRPTGKQPRQHFDEVTISELAESIFEHGLLQPILVTPFLESEAVDNESKYRIIAGERRFRACQVLKWQRIPAIVKTVSEIEHFQLSLIENIQREDLSPIDEALAYEHLIQISGLSQSELAKRLGKGRPALANSLRLLKLPPVVQDGLTEKRISVGHAKALLMIKDPDILVEFYEQCVADSWSVRETEQRCQRQNHPQDTESQTSIPSIKKEEPATSNLKNSTVHFTESNSNFHNANITDIDKELEDLETELQTQYSADISPRDEDIQQNTSTKSVYEPSENVNSYRETKRTEQTLEKNPITLNTGFAVPKESGRETQNNIDLLRTTRTKLRSQAAVQSEYWNCSGMLLSEEELKIRLSTAWEVSLQLHLEGNFYSSEPNANNVSVARPRSALLKIEFETPQQWDSWLGRLGLGQISLPTDSQIAQTERHNKISKNNQGDKLD